MTSRVESLRQSAEKVLGVMASKTQLSIEGERWLINGRPTYKGRRYRGWNVEGLLMNSRMTNAVFDDENPVTRGLFAYPDTGEWHADRNTNEFIAMLPVYRAHGLLAVTVNLQGGSPTGYYREPMFRENMADRGIEVDDEVVWAGLPSPDFTALAQLRFQSGWFVESGIYGSNPAVDCSM